MRNILRQGISFLLPIAVLILVHLSLVQDPHIKSIPAIIIGLPIIMAGLYLLVSTVSAIIRIGDGTLAPWSPTKKLVTTGTYRYVRNPMISAVLITLFGESITILSLKIFYWAIIFFIINNLFFLIYEEPKLEKRFGKQYREYKKKVPRWIPKIKKTDY